jgi:hypothetical protein
VRGRPPAVQDAGLGQEKCADADRPEAATGRGDPSEPVEERRIPHRAGANATNDEDGVGTAAVDVVIAPMRDERQPALSVDSSVSRRGDDLERIGPSSATQQAVRRAEDLRRPDEVELVHRGDHEEEDALPHRGWNLALPRPLAQGRTRDLAEIV